jgi:nitrate reductase gamma subunit
MPTWLEVAKGPPFRLALVVLVLGLLRLGLLSTWGMVTAIRRAADRRIPYIQIGKTTLSWLFPIRRLHRTRPVFSYASFVLHLGIIFAGLFLSNHISIFQANVGVTWLSIYRPILDGLTVAAIVAGAYLLLFRIYVASARSLSQAMDYILLLLILSIFISGYVAGRAWNPIPYDSLMLLHTINGIVLLILMPFTKIAHCVLYPLIRLGSEIAWHLAPHGGSDVIKTLYGSEGRKI